MSTPQLSLPVNLQERLISANLNSTMLFNFLMGIYTMTYGGTVYLYVSKRSTSTNRSIVLCLISALYLLCLLDFGLQWYFINWVVVNNGETRASVFLATVDAPQWMFIFNNIVYYCLFIVADGLLIWRCFYVWGRSFKSIAVPLILYIAEFGIFITETVLSGVISTNPTNAQATLGNNISSALAFISLGTTLSTTSLIAYRIHTGSQSNILRTRKAFTHVVTLIVESAAAYALVLLVWAVIIILPATSFVENPLSEVDLYVQTLLTIVACMAPTVLVARIAVKDIGHADSSPTAATHVSGLNFNRGTSTVEVGNLTRGDSFISSVVEESKFATVEGDVGALEIAPSEV